MRALLATVVLATVVGAASIASAQDRYGDPRNAPQGNEAIYQGNAEQRRYDDRDPRDFRDDRDRAPRPEAVFYADDRFGGRTLTLERRIRQMRDVGMNDRVSSIRIVSGRWLVCTDNDFRGRCVTLDRSVGRLSRLGMADKISSARPLRGDRDGDYGRDDAYRRDGGY